MGHFGQMIWGERTWNNQHLFRRIGYCPEHDSFYEDNTGWQFLTGLLQLLPIGRAEAEAALKRLGERLRRG